MSIHSITSNLFQQYPVGMIGSVLGSSGSSATSSLPGAPQSAAQTPPAGGLFDALMQALTQSGALTTTTAATSAAGTATTTTDATATSSIAAGSSSSSSTSNTSASNTVSPQQAMQAFIQKLVGALQAQGAGSAAATTASTVTTAAATTTAATGSTPASTGIDPTGTSSGVVRGHGHRGHGHGGHMGAALQNLIAEVDDASSTTATAGTTGATATSSSSAVATLQQSFQGLVSSMGGNSNASLSSFLSNFANDLSGMSLVGNLVNTQA